MRLTPPRHLPALSAAFFLGVILAPVIAGPGPAFPAAAGGCRRPVSRTMTLRAADGHAGAQPPLEESNVNRIPLRPLLAGFALGLALGGPAVAYRDKPVQYIIPFPAGG